MEIKNCPFCNSEAEFAPDDNLWVMCTKEGCRSMGPDGNYKTKAIEAWNKRPIENELIEALRKVRLIILDMHEGKHNNFEQIYETINNAISKAKGEVK